MLHLLICDQLLTRDWPASRRTVPRSAVGKGEHAAKLPAMKLLRSAAPRDRQSSLTEIVPGPTYHCPTPPGTKPRARAEPTRGGGRLAVHGSGGAKASSGSWSIMGTAKGGPGVVSPCQRRCQPPNTFDHSWSGTQVQSCPESKACSEFCAPLPRPQKGSLNGRISVSSRPGTRRCRP